MSKGGIPNRRWIESKLRACRMVEWDRFTESQWGPSVGITVYGWIYRADEYKDFVAVLFWPEDGELYYVTSSEKYSEKLSECLGAAEKGHEECRRVENEFNVENCISIHE